MEEYELDTAHKFSEEQIQKFRGDPRKYTKFLKAIEALSNKRFKTILRGSPEAIEAKRVISLYMAEALNYDKHLLEALIPSFSVGCRRVTPGIGYLKALTQPNVDVITSSIQEVQPNGIKLTNGKLIEVDAIICATGFNCSFIPRFPIIGQHGNLQDLWSKNKTQAYMSCMVPGMPNYIKFLGPNGPLAHGAIPIITE
ncbi:50c27d40-2747-4428-916d-3a89dcfd4a98 [Sclerotinia trifoliorum]|uniref:50c27d40-2747-4428-916d-3a89dcfd4a98 n=1 Tax=Sclerotinia trifoliorum TaxID=28548 RepID=A0A8H2VPW0_9HELO|nr:50c27d40-2747-4428-916d-3a89dcfd4a98 [Sclerotinia trifoliorum]